MSGTAEINESGVITVVLTANDTLAAGSGSTILDVRVTTAGVEQQVAAGTLQLTGLY